MRNNPPDFAWTKSRRASEYMRMPRIKTVINRLPPLSFSPLEKGERVKWRGVWFLALLIAGAVVLSLAPSRAEALLMLDPAPPEEVYKDSSPLEHIDPLHPPAGAVRDNARGIITVTREQAFGIYQADYLYEDHGVTGRWNLREIVYRADPRFSKIQVTNLPALAANECASLPINGKRVTVSWSGGTYEALFGANPQSAPSKVCANETDAISDWDRLYYTVSLYWDGRVFTYSSENQDFTDSGNFLATVTECLPNSDCTRSGKDDWTERMEYRLANDSAVYLWWREKKGSGISGSESLWYDFGTPRVTMSRFDDRFVQGSGLTSDLRAVRGPSVSSAYEYQETGGKKRLRRADVGDEQYFFFLNPREAENKHGYEKRPSKGYVEMYNAVGALYGTRLDQDQKQDWFDEERVPLRQQTIELEPETAGAVTTPASCNGAVAQYTYPRSTWSAARASRKVNGEHRAGGETYPYTSYFDENGVLRLTELWADTRDGRRLRTVEYNTIGELFREFYYGPDGATISDIYLYSPHSESPSDARAVSTVKKLISSRGGEPDQRETVREYGPDGRKTYSHLLKTGSSPDRLGTECYEFKPADTGGDSETPYTTTIYFAPNDQVRTDYDSRYGATLPANDPKKGIFETKITTYTITPTPIHGANLIKEEKFLGSAGQTLLTTTWYFVRAQFRPGVEITGAEMHLQETFGTVYPVRVENLFHGEAANGTATSDFAPGNLRARAPNYLLVWDYGPFHSGNEEGRAFTSTTKFETSAASPQFGKPLEKYVFPLALRPFPNPNVAPEWGVPTITPSLPVDYLTYHYDAGGILTSIRKYQSIAPQSSYTERGTTYFRGTGAVSRTETLETYPGERHIQSVTTKRYAPDGTVESHDVTDFVKHTSYPGNTFPSTTSFYDQHGMLTEVVSYTDEGADSKRKSGRLYFGTATGEAGNIPFIEWLRTYSGNTYTEETAFIYLGPSRGPLYSTATCTFNASTDALTGCTQTHDVIYKNLGDKILSTEGITGSAEQKIVQVIQKLLREYKTVLAAAGSETQREAEYVRYASYLTAAISAIEFEAHGAQGFNTDAKLQNLVTGWVGYDKRARTNFRGLYIMPIVNKKISALGSPDSIFIDMTTESTVQAVLNAIGETVEAADYDALRRFTKRLDLWDVSGTASQSFALDANGLLLRTMLTDGGNVAYVPWQQLLLATPTTGKLIQDMLDELRASEGIDLDALAFPSDDDTNTISITAEEIIKHFYRYFYKKRLVDYSQDAGDVVQPAHLSVLRGLGDCDDYAALGLNLLYNLLLRLGKEDAAENLGYVIAAVGDPETSAVVGHGAVVWKSGETLYYIETGALFQGLGKSTTIVDNDILVPAPLHEGRREGDSKIANWHFQIQYRALQKEAVQEYPVRIGGAKTKFFAPKASLTENERGTLSKSERVLSLPSYFTVNNLKKPGETREEYLNSPEGREEMRVSALARSIIRHIPRLGEQTLEDVLAYVHSVIYANSDYRADGATDEWKRVRDTLTADHLDELGYLKKKLVGDCEDLAFVEASVVTVALAYYHIERLAMNGTVLSAQNALRSARSQVRLIAERRNDLGEGAAHLSVAVFLENPGIVLNTPFIILDPQLPHPSELLPYSSVDTGTYLFTASASGLAALRTENWEKLNFMASVTTGGPAGGASDQSSQRKPNALLPDFPYMQNDQVTGQTERTPRGEHIPEVTVGEIRRGIADSSARSFGGRGAVEITVNPSIGHTDEAPITSAQPVVIPPRIIDTCCGTGQIIIPGDPSLGVPATIYVLHPATVVGGGTPYPPPPPQPPPPICGIAATPPAIQKGETAILTWNSERSETATLTWKSKDSETAQLDGIEVQLNGTRSITPTEETSYVLTVTRGKSSSSCRTTVTIKEPTIEPEPRCTLTVTPLVVVKGAEATLKWSSQNATAASLNDEAVALSGEKTLKPFVAQTYALTVTDASGKRLACIAAVNVTSPDPDEDGGGDGDPAPLAPLCAEEFLCGSPEIESKIVTEKPKNSHFIGAARCSLTPTGPCFNRRYSTGWECNVGFTRNTRGTTAIGDDTCDPPPYRDIGLRIRRGGQTYSVAGALHDEMLSPFRLWRRDTGDASGTLQPYGTLLVPPRHPDASGLRILQGGKVWSFITVPTTR